MEIENKTDKHTFYAETREQWREWLKKNCKSEKSVQLVLYNKNSSTLCVSYAEAVEEALCFGWIDSRANKRDQESRYQLFTPRKPKSNWSKSNIERVETLISKGLMTQHGQELVDFAKKTGGWEAADKSSDK